MSQLKCMRPVTQPATLANAEDTDILEILVLGKSAASQTIGRLLDGLFQVVIVEELEFLNSNIFEHDFSLIVITDSFDISPLESMQRVQANQLCNDVPIIAMLAEQDPKQEFSILEAGAIDCIIAPINPITLTTKIKNHMKQAEHTRQLELISYTDGLTGLNNRIQLDTILLREWFNARRGQHVISALMIDVDFFKPYNDTFGHLQGDECLKSIASVIQNTRRRGSDFAARFGGEEFVMLLPFTDSEGAGKLAQTLVKKVRKLNIQSALGHDHPVTVSIGVSTYFPHLHENDSDKPWKLLESADAKLYEAKLAGRNCYRC